MVRSLITLSISLFIGSVISLKSSDSADEMSEGFKSLHWKDSSTKNTFKIKTNNNIRLQIVDYKNAGDVFEVFDNGISLGKTSTPAVEKDGKVEFAFTPEEALEKEAFSKGTFELLAGDHKITIKAISPYGAGTAAIRLLGKDRVFMRMVKRGSDDYGDDEDKEYDADDEDDEDDCDDEEEEEEEDDEHEHEKKKHHYVQEGEQTDDSWNEDDSGNNEDCITDVDTAHTRTLLKTVYTDSPDRPYHYMTIGEGMDDDSINLDVNGANYESDFRSVIALDTW